jgi:hypothetical protein
MAGPNHAGAISRLKSAVRIGIDTTTHLHQLHELPHVQPAHWSYRRLLLLCHLLKPSLVVVCGDLTVFALNIVWLHGHPEVWGDLGVVAGVEFLHLELEGEG